MAIGPIEILLSETQKVQAMAIEVRIDDYLEANYKTGMAVVEFPLSEGKLDELVVAFLRVQYRKEGWGDVHMLQVDTDLYSLTFHVFAHCL
jgi:hypothetical protein